MNLMELENHKLQILGRMAGDIAHDFNNLLAIIEGYAQMMQRQFGEEPGLNDKLQVVLDATARGTTLTKRLSDFGAEKPVGTGSCDLSALMKDNSVLLKPVLRSRTELVMNVDEQEILLPCCADTATQIMINFAMSARLRHAGRVMVSVTATRDRAFMIFRDNADAPATMSDELQQAHQLIQLMGGVLDVSGRPGCSELTAVLPILRQRALPRQLRDKTVLVVDDEEQLLPVLENHLESMGLKVLKAANADTALLMQQTHPEKIDFLLTDIMMPGTDGVRLAEMLGQQSPEMGVVYMTGRHDSKAFVGEVFQEAPVVTKPLRPESLSMALEKALAQLQDI